MIPTSDPDILIERMTWFDTAFRGMCKPATERLQIELESHYDHVFQQNVNVGGSEMDAHRAGMAALGNAKAARKNFRAKYLTEWQYRRLEKDGAFNSPPYSRMMEVYWGLGLFFFTQSAQIAVHSPNLFWAGGGTIAGILSILVAAVAFSLRGKSPQGDFYWLIPLFMGAWTVFIISLLLVTHITIGDGRVPTLEMRDWQTQNPYAWQVLVTELLGVAVLSLGICFNLRQIRKARNTGLIGPKRNKGAQPN